MIEKAKILIIGTFDPITGNAVGWAFGGGPGLVISKGEILAGGYSIEELHQIVKDAKEQNGHGTGSSN